MVQQGSGKNHMVMGQQPAGFVQFDGLQELLMREGQAFLFFAAPVLGRDQAEEEVAFFRSDKAVLQRRTIRKNRYGPLVGHPHLIAKGGQKGINPFQQLFDAIDGG